MHMTVRGGVRSSTRRSYLEPVRNRSNLTVITGAEVDRIELEEGVAKRVVFKKAGAIKVGSTRREVVLSAGSIGSPSILQRSGIGPANVLSDAGVAMVHELPSVGENLTDHLEVYFQYRCTQPVTILSLIHISEPTRLV